MTRIHTEQIPQVLPEYHVQPDVISPVNALPEAIERVSWRRRIGHRVAAAVLSFTAAFTGMEALDVEPAQADPNLVYNVVDADIGFYYRNSPHLNDTKRINGVGIYTGDQIELICGQEGDPVGDKNNTWWHYIKNKSRPGIGEGWISDHNTTTPNKAGDHTPGEKECGAPEPSKPEVKKESVKGCYFNLKAPSKNLTFSYEGDHQYLGNAYQAAQNWTDAGAGISIKFDNNSNTYIRIRDIKGPAKGSYGEAIMPDIWKKPHSKMPANPNIPGAIMIELNVTTMERLDDFHRTHVIVHEIGHALGLAHSTECGYGNTSIMMGGDGALMKKDYNTPMPFDKNALKQLYS